MIPIFIISFNRYTVLRKLIDRLLEMNEIRIVVIDNKSNYEPLLQYYEVMKGVFEIIHMPGNAGHLVITSLGRDPSFRGKYELDKLNFMYTDCDIVPVTECPNNFMEKFDEILKKYPVDKIGLGLKIDDLPDCFEGKKIVVNWECQFWGTKIHDESLDVDLYPAAIDTTFSYRRAGTIPGWAGGYRTGHPYIARHLPWYVDGNNLSDEDKNYMNTVKGSSSWVSYTRKS